MNGAKERSNGIRAYGRHRSARQGCSRSAYGQARGRGRRSLCRHEPGAFGQGLPRHCERRSHHLGAHRLADVDDVRARLLRDRDDADVDAALRRRALRFCAARVPAAIGCDDCGRHADEQDGARAAQGLRPDAGAALRHLHGLVRQRRRLLPLFLFSRTRLRPHRAGRHLRARMPADRGGATLRRAVAAEEDPSYRHDRALNGFRAMDETLDKLGEMIAGALPGSVSAHRVAHGELTISAIAGDMVKVATFLRDDERCQFWSIIDVTAVDWPGREQRFDIVYHFLSPKQNQRIRVKVEVDETTPVPSIIGVFPGANWFERETYDLYGVLFTGHPDMRRLLTDYGFEGHPLRKDFPLTGFVEVRYDDEQKRVVYEPVRLAQEFRNFDFLSPWEGPAYLLPGDEKAGNGKGG